MADMGEVWIESTRGPQGNPACRLTVGGITGYPPVEDVRGTALDLIEASVWAEFALELTQSLDLAPRVVARMVSQILDKTGRGMFGRRTTLEIFPAGSSSRGVALVRLRRADYEGELITSEARVMASYWLAVAEATESDGLVGRGLAHLGVEPRVTLDLFAWLRTQRGQDAHAATERS
jgi:hypothetical protein